MSYDAGADHVPVQLLTSPDKVAPALTELAGPLGLGGSERDCR
ncbi:hypothetical protein [Mycobacterium sp. DL592]|nr:hypothetical protein [Mycobacterium sp. DL592]